MENRIVQVLHTTFAQPIPTITRAHHQLSWHPNNSIGCGQNDRSRLLALLLVSLVVHHARTSQKFRANLTLRFRRLRRRLSKSEQTGLVLPSIVVLRRGGPVRTAGTSGARWENRAAAFLDGAGNENAADFASGSLACEREMPCLNRPANALRHHSSLLFLRRTSVLRMPAVSDTIQ